MQLGSPPMRGLIFRSRVDSRSRSVPRNST